MVVYKHKKNQIVYSKNKYINSVFLFFINNNLYKYLKFLLIILFFFISKKWFVFSVFTILTYYIIYYSKLWHLPLDVSPLFFFGVIITKYYGFQYMMLFYLLAYFIPKTLAGQSANWISYIFILISWFSFLTVFLFPSLNLRILGYITSLIQFTLSAMFQSTMKPLFISILDGIGNVLNNLIWFLIFSDIIVWIMKFVF
ncbi:MAG: hypothetical protein QW757_03885 [Candidatus Woesearchaeota archaeon]